MFLVILGILLAFDAKPTMGKGKKQKQLSPEEQRERAEKRRIANGGAPPGDKSSAPGGGGGLREGRRGGL